MNSEAEYPQLYSKTITINASPAMVWEALTVPELMKRWMSETPIDIITDWIVGNPIIIKGDWYKKGFENKGRVLKHEKEKVLSYNHLSSLSRLPDVEGSYSVIEFTLQPEGDSTILTTTLSNFPTYTIYKHLEFYWNVTVEELKKLVEA